MPLSDHEQQRQQQILQEIERQFYEQDPDFARGVGSQTLQAHLIRNVRRGLGLFVLGFGVLLAFFFRPNLIVGVISFLLMLAGATIAYHNARRLSRGEGFSKDPRFSRLLSNFEGRFKDFRRRKES